MGTQRLLDEQLAEAAERAAWAAALEAFRQSLGTTPRERLTWLLDFAYRQDVERLTEPERERLWWSLRLVIREATGQWAIILPERQVIERISSKGDRTKWARLWARLPKSQQLMMKELRDAGVDVGFEVARYKVAAKELRDAQQAVRAVAEGVIGGRLYHRVLSAPRVVARLGPKEFPAPPTPRSRFVLTQWFFGSLPDAAVIGTLALIAKIPPTLLRRCPYQSGPPPDRIEIQAGLPIGACGRAFVGVKRQKWCAEHQEAARRERNRRAAATYRQNRKNPSRRKGRKGGRR
jgi:hypothetical protein